MRTERFQTTMLTYDSRMLLLSLRQYLWWPLYYLPREDKVVLSVCEGMWRGASVKFKQHLQNQENDFFLLL